MVRLLLWICVVTVEICSQSLVPGVLSSTTITIVNNCDHPVWPAVLSNAGIAPLQTTGFALQKGEAKVLNVPSSWSGRFWGRTHCSEDSAGKFTCGTGDCGSGNLECAGAGPFPPATLAEFTLAGDGGMDCFDVSLVDGFNIPMTVSPIGGSGDNCNSAGCTVDLNTMCPSESKVVFDGQMVACESYCGAFGRQEKCCSGAYDSRETCKQSQLFKTACPHASSYSYHDQNTTFTCTGANYQVTFCPHPSNSSKKSKEEHQTPRTPQVNKGMPYEGADVMGGSNGPQRFTNIGKVIGVTVGTISGGILTIALTVYVFKHRGCPFQIGITIGNESCNWFNIRNRLVGRS